MLSASLHQHILISMVGIIGAYYFFDFVFAAAGFATVVLVPGAVGVDADGFFAATFLVTGTGTFFLPAETLVALTGATDFLAATAGLGVVFRTGDIAGFFAVGFSVLLVAGFATAGFNFTVFFAEVTLATAPVTDAKASPARLTN